MIRADGVTVRIAGRAIIEAVGLTIEPGFLTAILGPNGAGKSTLLRCLSGETAPDDGTVALDGIPLSRWAGAALARRRAVLPQHVACEFPLTARQVVALGRSPFAALGDHRADRLAVARAMAMADVAALAERSYPTLSGGEQQRVQLARVLAQCLERPDPSPGYLLLDEPTASLDLAHQWGVLRIARGLAQQGFGVLAVLHDLNQAALCADRIMLLQRGRVAASGPPSQVLTAARIEAVFGWPVTVLRHPTADRPLIAAAS